MGVVVGVAWWVVWLFGWSVGVGEGGGWVESDRPAHTQDTTTRGPRCLPLPAYVPVKEISPVIATSARTGRFSARDRSAVVMVTPAEGPSCGWWSGGWSVGGVETPCRGARHCAEAVSTYRSINLAIYQSIYLSNLSIHPSIHPSINQSTNLSIDLQCMHACTYGPWGWPPPARACAGRACRSRRCRAADDFVVLDGK